MKRGLSPAFVDLLMLLVVLFILLPHRPEISVEDAARVGDMVVEISWPDGQRSDVDLWVRSPGDRPVGYSRLRGKDCSLLRDDLGNRDTPEREEILGCRSLPDGEWVVNLHLYTDIAGTAPFPVRVYIWYRPGGTSGRLPIYHDDVTLERTGQELTVARWTMQDGKFLPGSLHYSPVALRAPGQRIGGGP